MKKYRIYQVDSFTTQKIYGNLARVVTNADGLSDEQMQPKHGIIDLNF